MSESPYYYELEQETRRAIESGRRDRIIRQRQRVETEKDCEEISDEECSKLLTLLEWK